MAGEYRTTHVKTGTGRRGVRPLLAGMFLLMAAPLAAMTPAAAQTADQRVLALEEQVRSLSGQVEELNFLLLQMQEQLRKMQEDVDFRFRQIEEGALQGSGDEMLADVPDGEVVAPETGDGAAVADNGVQPGEVQLGAPPRDLGTLRVPADGTIGDTAAGAPMDLRGDTRSGTTDDTTVAALPQAGNAEELYGSAYEYVLSGDYRMAEAAFRRHIEQFPDDPRTADARYWLGESLLAQERYTEAAEVFLAARRDHPDARKAPDMLLKLGVSLSAMGNRDLACAAFKEVGVRYPEASAAMRERVRQEQALAGC